MNPLAHCTHAVQGYLKVSFLLNAMVFMVFNFDTEVTAGEHTKHWITHLVLDKVRFEQGDLFLQTVELLMQIPAGQKKSITASPQKLKRFCLFFG